MSVEVDERAIYELPTNVVVAAGAGTGKTHRLTGLYVHLALGLTDVADGAPVPPTAIVATTFTREAASEMRARIEARLRTLADAPFSALLDRHDASRSWIDELARTFTRRRIEPPRPEIARRALEALPRATITTFHAWAGELVRAHALDAGVPPAFTLLEPEDSDAILARAADDVVVRWIDDAGPAIDGLSRADAIRALLAGGSARLEDAIRRALLRIAEEGVDPSRVGLADEARDLEGAQSRRAALVRALEAIAPRAERKKPELRGAIDALRAIAERAHPSAEERAIFGEHVRALTHAVSVQERGAVRAILDEARGRSTADQAQSILVAEARTRRAIALDGASRVLLAEVARAVEAEKRRRRALDFSDVLRRARDLLLHSPAIQREVAGEVRALLVDEFQDTNALQRDLVYLVHQAAPAIDRRAAGALPDPRTLRPTGLFVVGDRKQSIYAFRGADVGVFQRIALDLAGEGARGLVSGEVGEARVANGALIALGENRRSVGDVLRFVNAFSAVDMRGHEALSPIEQVVFEETHEALRAVRDDRTGARVVVPHIAPPPSGELGRDLAASLALAAELRSLLDAPSRHGLESLRARDVAILVRTYAIVPALELALDLHRVPYDVSARRGLYATTEAGDLEAFVRLAVDPLDRHALLAVLRGPYVALSDGALLALCGEHGLRLPDRDAPVPAIPSDEERRLGRLRAVLDDLHLRGERLGASRALRRALDALHVEETLALMPRGEQRIGDLRKLLEVVDRMTHRGFGTLADVARHLADARAALEAPDGRTIEEARGAVFDRDDDVVRVMTIHASKGLEFRVVAVMQADHGGRPAGGLPIVVGKRGGELALAARVVEGGVGAYGAGGQHVVDRASAAEAAERQRLTYVAHTRARDLLWVVSGPHLRTPNARSAAASLEKIDPSLCARPTWEPRLQSPAPPTRSSARDDDRWPTLHHVPFAGELVTTTALADFDACARRFRLLHVVGLPEHGGLPSLDLPAASHAVAAKRQLALFEAPPNDLDPTIDLDAVETLSDDEAALVADLPVAPPPLDPRSQGVLAHLAIERAPLPDAIGRGRAYADAFLRGEGYDPSSEPGRSLVDRVARFLDGAYARSLAAAGVDVRREVPFVVPLPSGISLRGTIDLLVARPDRIEVVDYKLRRRGDDALAKYALQLRAYGAAVASASFRASRPVATGLAFLGDGDGEPLWLSESSGDLSALDRVARAFLEARFRGAFPKVARPRCDALACGYRPLCWPRDRRSRAR